MFQRFKRLDARRLNLKTKRAALIGDFLDNDEKEEITGEPQLPKEDELTPVKSLPGAPKGMKGEVIEEYTPMSAAEIEKKRKEHEEKVTPAIPATEGEEEFTAPKSFRDVMKNLLQEDSIEGKKERAQQMKYGPPEKIQETVDILKEFHGTRLMDIDVETAQAILTRADLPDVLKERAQRIFDSHSNSDMLKSEQMALSSLNAIMPKQVKDRTEWLRDTAEGQQYQRKIFDKYRIGRVMSMLENTVLMMAGQSVIDQPRPQGASSEQRAEKKRLDQLGGALQEGTITNTEFDDAKRLGWSLKQLMKERNKGKATRLNMRKEAEGDVTGPGGDSWEYEWTSGPTPTKDEPQKRKQRFPFHNKPSGYTPGEGDQGNLHDIGPLGGQQDMNYLANIIESMSKTSDNDLFSIYSFDNGGKWLTYTLFKRAYAKFRPGDIVVQYGKVATDCRTYRRRFGSVKKAKISLVDALSPILATIVGQPSPDDSLHDLQKGKGEPGGAYGPRTNPYDKQPEQGNRDGFDAKNTPRQRTKRKFIPHMDSPNDEGSGFPGGSTMGSTGKKLLKQEKKADFAAPVIETPEERAATIEQPAVKPINKDPKRPTIPKKRYDRFEQNLTSNPDYMGEDSSGFDKERILLSMKKKKK